MSNTELLLILVIVATAGASFTLGRMSVIDKAETVRASADLRDQKQINTTQQASVNQAEVMLDEQKTQIIPNGDKQQTPPSPERSDDHQRISSDVFYVASKNGTKYHLPWCPGAKQIKEANKITFHSKEDAESAGYTPASNCKGI